MKKNKTIQVALLMMSLIAYPASASMSGADASSNGLTMQQQPSLCKGVVVDTSGEPLMGASIVVKGTTNGTVTGIDGNFNLSGVKKGSRLVISFIGFMPKEIIWNGSPIKVELTEDNKTLDEVVVVGFGTQKKENLTGSVSQVKMADVLGDRPVTNAAAALQGAMPGLTIGGGTGPGQSKSFNIRGTLSINGGSPLVLIDNVEGDISLLNPDDIESMSILKGASAAALYGSQAANGVILITTKSGKAGMSRITFSSNLTVDHAISLPQFQNNYGQTADGTSSWGSKGNLTDYDNVDNWFGNGITAINSLTFQTGNDKMQTYFSYANTRGTGIVDSNKLQKHNITFRETASFFNDRLKLDGNASLMTQTIRNTPAGGGYYLNPLVGLYSFPRGADLAPYAENFEVFDTDRNMNLQNWYTKNEDGSFSEWDQNPYWIKNRVTNKSKRYRALASISANLKATDWLSFQARGNVDYVSDKFDNKMYASTAANIAGKNDETGLPNGRYVWSDEQNFQVYGDFMAMFNKTLGDFSINAALGTSINVSKANSLMIDSKTASLYRPNVFTVSNIIFSSKGFINQTIDAKRTIQSLFGTAQVGWKDALYLDVTARNDWSSTLANTESMKNGFFYPSVGLTWIMSNSVKLPEWINFSKFRGSFAQVGNDLPIGITNLADIIQCGGSIQTNDIEQRGDLKPEISTSIEFGTEWKFFNNRFGIDFTWYRTDTKNQLLKVANPAGSLYAFRYINAGKIRNTGIELTVEGTPLMNENFRWKTAVNMSMNRNKVVSLHKDYKSFRYGSEGFSMAYDMWVKEGGKLGDIYGNGFERDENGKIKVNEAGNPIKVTGNNTLLGNANPDALLGWSNTFTYKGFTLYFLIDARIGGDVMSLTQAHLDAMGVSKESGEARDRGYVEYEGIQFKDVPNFYGTVGGRNGISEYYMYDATNVRLRELTLGYSFPASILSKTKFIKGLDLTLVARNLFFLYKDAPFDPDATLSVGNTLQGVDVFGMPTTRNIGFNVKFTF